MNNFVLSMKITADGAQAIAAVRETERAIGQLHDEVRAKREADIQAYAASMDRLRALYDPVFAASKAYEAELEQLNAALQVGAIDARVHAEALERLNASYLAMTPAANTSMSGAARSTKLAAHEVTNLSYQMNDIVMMLASGQSPFLLMMQQGSQVAQIMGRRGLRDIFPALGAGLMSLVTPTTMALAGVTALGYAVSAILIPALSDAEGKVKPLEDAITDLDEATRAFKSTISEGSVERLVEQFGLITPEVIELQRNLQDLRLREIQIEALAAGTALAKAFSSDGLFQSGSQRLAETFDLNLGQLAQMEHLLVRIGAARTIEDQVKAVGDLEAAILATTGGVENMNAAQIAFYRDVVSSERALRQAEAAGMGLDGVISSAADEASRLAGNLDAAVRALSNIAAPTLSNREQVNAAFSNAINAASGNVGLMMLADAEYIQTLGRIEGIEGGIGIPVPTARPNDIERLDEEDRIRERLARSGSRGRRSRRSRRDPAADMIAAQEEDLERIRLEAALIGATAEERELAIAAMEAEQEIRRRGIDARSEEAGKIRELAITLTQEEIALEQSRAAWGAIEDAAMGAIDRIVDALFDSKADIGDVLEDIGRDIAKTALMLALINPLKNTLFGTSLPTLGGLFSFEGGGETPKGPRTGGVDGRGGMFAIVHPNETIIDHEKSGAAVRIGSAARSLPEAHVAPPQEIVVRSQIVSRFDADGGFQSAVEKVSRPVAEGAVRDAAPALLEASAGNVFEKIAREPWRTR